MTKYAAIAFFFALLLLAISQLRRRHSHEIYVIWYIFSLSFLIFLYLYFTTESAGQEITDVFGKSAAKPLTVIYNYLTNVDDEFRLVSAVVCLAVAPQLLAYFLSGLSGSATSPMFVRQTGKIAIWSLIKFMAALGGILLAHPLAELVLGKQLSTSDFLQAIAIISTAFILAVMLHRYFDQDFELHIMPGLRVHIRVPMLLKIHEFFTRYARQLAASSDAVKTPEREFQVNTFGIIFHLRGLVPVTIHDLLTRHNRQAASEQRGDCVMSISQEATALREHRLAYLIEGILLLVLGGAAIVVPIWATFTMTIFLGWLFLLSGIIGLTTTFWLKRAPGFWWSLLSAALAVVVGALLIAWPISGAMSLTLALLIYFVAEGIFSIMFGLEHQRALSGRWGWLVLNGIINLFLVGVILFGLPGTAAWVLGLLVGIDLVYGGSALIGLSLTARGSKSA